jgi:hypothetical protein
MFYVCSLKEKAECPVLSKPFRLPPIAAGRSEARRPARQTKAGRQEPIVGLLNRGVSVAGIGAGGPDGKAGASKVEVWTVFHTEAFEIAHALPVLTRAVAAA